jgi:hypothetical protein
MFAQVHICAFLLVCILHVFILHLDTLPQDVHITGTVSMYDVSGWLCEVNEWYALVQQS